MSDVPDGLTDTGVALWHGLLEQDPSLARSGNPVRAIALQACRTKERCDVLDQTIRGLPSLVVGPPSRRRIHPAVVEARKQAEALRALLVALRLPDSQTGKRPQYRGPRGTYRR